MYDNEYNRKIANMLHNIIRKKIANLDAIIEDGNMIGADVGTPHYLEQNDDPVLHHRMLGGSKKTLSKGVALYEPEEEETFEGNGAPLKNKNARTWIQHVLAFKTKHKCSYKEAMVGAKSTYKKGVVKTEPVKKEPVKKEEVKKEPELRRSSRKATVGGAYLREQMKPSSFVGGKKTSNWIEHIKKFSKENNISYKEALTQGKASYKK